LRQCSEAAWNHIASAPQRYQTYGANAVAFGPAGCWQAIKNHNVIYYNAGPPSRVDARKRPVCGVAANIDGGRMRERQPSELPGGVEHLPVNTECEEGSELNLEQCAKAMVELGLKAPQNRGISSAAEYWPIYTSWQNPQRKYSPPTQQGPRGCFTVHGHETITYWSQDQPQDEFKSAPNRRRPVCAATTTTTTPEDTGEVCKHYETKQSCPSPRCSWDGDSCADPPCSSYLEEGQCCGDCEWKAGMCKPALFKACPKEGKPGTNKCPKGCTFVDNCEQCEFVAGVWQKDFSSKPWPAASGSRPQGCFRNRKFNIKCNRFEPGSKYPSGVDKVGTKKGKWPICKMDEPPKKC